VHAHAVSSAYGLLGYHTGRALLEEQGEASVRSRPASLLVQHLATPDMVLALLYGSADESRIPAYHLDPATGYHRRVGDNPRFPAVTYDPGEVLDPTFYTHRPVTSAAMNELIGRFGGDGLVVSLAECIERYPYTRGLLSPAALPLPADLRRLREWSTVMAFTGVLNAIDRGLLAGDRDVVVHGTGSYTDEMYQPLGADALTEVSDLDDVTAAITAA
jgi:Family of unknown function (DUF6002)